MKSVLRRVLGALSSPIVGAIVGSTRTLESRILDVRELLLVESYSKAVREHANPLNAFGRKIFSQSDEDGITIEIIRRLEIDRGTYAEFGVGNGTENNTLILAALGWSGFWVGGQELAISVPQASKHFAFFRKWIDKSNVVALAKEGMTSVGAQHLDVISLDLDGNDIYLVRDLLASGIRPKLFVVEYNAKFPPPIKFSIAYDPSHTWMGDDYFGASLASFVEMFDEFDYMLVCCNSGTGSNAFFVQRTFADKFLEIPQEMAKLYSPPNYILQMRFSHPTATKTIDLVLAGGQSSPIQIPPKVKG